jgi:hypothetical protein
MKRRYSNFHRARKYHRKWLRRNRHDHLVDAGHYRGMYEKYDMAAYLCDGVNTGFADVDRPQQRLIILAHFDPEGAKSWLSDELRYKPSDVLESCHRFISECHQFALGSLSINDETLEKFSHDR